MCPYKPLLPCKQLGCPNLTGHPRGYCSEHLPERYQQEDANRPSSSNRGYDARWHKASRLYLKKHPLCVECAREGRVEAATVVDHIIPHKGDPVLFWDESNWQSLCKMHHDKKTISERGKGD